MASTAVVAKRMASSKEEVLRIIDKLEVSDEARGDLETIGTMGDSTRNLIHHAAAQMALIRSLSEIVERQDDAIRRLSDRIMALEKALPKTATKK